MPSYVPLPGSNRTLLPNSQPAGPIDPSEIASLTVRVRSAGDPKKLVKKAYALAKSPLTKRKYLTHAQVEKSHGASKEDLDKVEHFAQQHDLMVVHRSAAERSVVLKGRLGDLLTAFHAEVQMYHHAVGTYRGRQGEIKLPEELSTIVTGVFGFDTRPSHRESHKQKNVAQNGPSVQNGVPATEYASRYNFPNAHNSNALDGAGQTIAFIELGGGFRTSDLTVFFKEIGLSAPIVSSVSVDHAGNSPTTPASQDSEVMLDLEVAGAVAPKATLVVYFAPNSGQGLVDAVSAAVHDSQRKPTVISISWGVPEDSLDQQSIDAFHEIFAAAATMGITVCAATGDHGTAVLDAAHWDHKIHVSHPASDDLVLACGGTQIDSNSNDDVVWNNGKPFDANPPGSGGWATGGGISEIFKVPSYQKDPKPPVSISNGKAGRGIPDIAMCATNYFSRVDGQEGAQAGTSAVAPLMAGLVARLNQAKGKNVGFLNPFLYANVAKGITHDVTSGTNAIKDTVKGYDAGPGWDACSGLGTPDGTAILNTLS